MIEKNTYIRYIKNDSGEYILDSMKEDTLMKNIINEKIDPDLFEYESMGLKPGDQGSDNRFREIPKLIK